jgi:NADPH:quinone reductase-like Zn-dependent oxidoreductase
MMKAITQRRYGSPDVLEFADVDTPAVGDDVLLVRVGAAGVDPSVWHFMRGAPYIMRAGSGLRTPRAKLLGSDLAGTVEAVGRNVTNFKPGDQVYGVADGSFAEYVRVRPGLVALKPAGLSFEQAAAVPISAVTALQGLRDSGRLRPGQRVLINGASGGVGTFAVQIAKALGAEVTGVCGPHNVELVRSLGADHVIDYTAADFSRAGRSYDIVFDLVFNHSLADFRRALTPTGTLVLCSGNGGPWIGPIGRILGASLLSMVVRQRIVFLRTAVSTADLDVLTGLIESGRVTPVIDRSYPLSDTADAIRRLETGHARGKIVVSVQ